MFGPSKWHLWILCHQDCLCLARVFVPLRVATPNFYPSFLTFGTLPTRHFHYLSFLLRFPAQEYVALSTPYLSPLSVVLNMGPHVLCHEMFT